MRGERLLRVLILGAPSAEKGLKADNILFKFAKYEERRAEPETFVDWQRLSFAVFVRHVEEDFTRRDWHPRVIAARSAASWKRVAKPDVNKRLAQTIAK